MATTDLSSSPPHPPSPGVGAVPLPSALGELLRFVLSSHLASPDPALPLSSSYSSRLLDDDLCEKLATELAGCVEEGRLPRAPAGAGAVGIPPTAAAAEEGSQEREKEWEAVVLEKGAELKRVFEKKPPAKLGVLVVKEGKLEAKVDNVGGVSSSRQSTIMAIAAEAIMYDAVEFVLHVQEPYFTQLRAGAKNVEGRLAAGNYNRITEGSLLLFNKCLLLNVEAVRHYGSFSEMLQAETISNVLPGISSTEEGVKVYRKFYTKEKENSNGVLAISVSKPPSQPYLTIRELLAGLGYDGLGRLLGLANTTGTIPDGLPPPSSVLTSSCMKLHQPTVKGCSLTDAARALAKHVRRSSDGWWGSLHGSDPIKNQLASEVIDRLLRDCCWMNVHLTQPYGPVFEIRVPEGYGARWSQDGSKFIGFLEPYTPEGFLKGWKH